jgi:hypothetical protein
MTIPRETIDVDEYIDAFRTWAFLVPYFADEERAVVDGACAEVAARHRGVVAIEALCRAMRAWAERNAGPRVAHLSLQVEKSCLLARLIYAGEPLRTERCPIHDGRWSGCEAPCPVGCDFGSNLTGWLPNLPASWPTTGTADLDALVHAGMPGDARRALAAATDVVRGEALHKDPRVWLWRVQTALDALRAGFVDPHDEDGWALGGVASVRNLVFSRWRQIHE